MLKNKELRDTFLLVSMGVVVILFILYLIDPFGWTKKAMDKPEPGIPADRSKKSAAISVQSEHEDYLSLLNNRLESELDRISEIIMNSKRVFMDFPVENLKEILAISNLEEKTREAHPLFFTQLKKALMTGFYDLKDLFEFKFSDDVPGRLKFNIFVSLFLLKLKSENVPEEILEFPDSLFRKVVTCVPYLAIQNEVDKNYQSLPILFYFQTLVSRLDMFPTTNIAGFFLDRIGDIRDLSPGKWVTRAAELLGFSSEPQPFRVLWKEADDLNPDDTGVYPNLKIKTNVFFKQIYLVFPDFQNPKNNKWIKELCEADSGDIELAELQICHEDAGKNMRIEKIYYTPGKSQFIVLLRSFDFSGDANHLNRSVISRQEDFLQNFLRVDFGLRSREPESFTKELLHFGHFLKVQVFPSLK